MSDSPRRLDKKNYTEKSDKQNFCHTIYKKGERFYKKARILPVSLGCGMNCRIHATSVVGGKTVSPTDRK